MTPSIMVAIDSVCLVFLMLVLLAYIILPRNRVLRTDGFFYCLVFTVIGVVTDIVAWSCEIVPSPAPLQYAGNFIALIAASFIAPAFGYYIADLVNEKQPLSYTFAHIITTLNSLGLLVVLLGALFGKLFYLHPSEINQAIMIYDDGGFFYEFPIIISMLSLVFLFVLVLTYAKTLGRQKIIVFSIYFLLPLVSGVLEVVFDNLQLSYAATSVSLSIVYVMLQSSHMNEILLREKILNEFSYVDQLTGLLNRRACDRDMESIQDDDSVSVVFCDLNGLKKINDGQGHHAGDQFLITFSKMLLNHFPHDHIYRISGDEFLVVERNMERDEFEGSVAQLKKEIDANAGIAALGTISGTGGSISALVKKAETNMYGNKKEFYRQYPEYRR